LSPGYNGRNVDPDAAGKAKTCLCRGAAPRRSQPAIITPRALASRPRIVLSQGDLFATEPARIGGKRRRRIDRTAARPILRTKDFLGFLAEHAMTEIAVEPVGVTESALKRVAEVLKSEAPGAFLRVSVSGGGCSGFQYAFDIVPAAEDGDLILGDAQARVAVDSVSLDFLKGARIDFVDDLMGTSFRIDNPNATASCGCGTSFAI
jgi:iron-sulfur cluster assembly accessory protein